MRTRNCLLIAFCFIFLCGKLYAQPTGSEDQKNRTHRCNGQYRPSMFLALLFLPQSPDPVSYTHLSKRRHSGTWADALQERRYLASGCLE